MADEHITEKRRNRKRKNAQSETQGDERVGTFVISDTIEDSGSRAILGIDLFEEEEGRYHVHTSTSYSLSEAFSEGKSEGLSYSEGSTTSSSEAKSLTRSYSKGHASSYVQTKGRETSGIFSSN